jgi:signal transduction histidine kinase
MRKSVEIRSPKTALRWLLKFGRPAGVLLVVAAIIGVALLRTSYLPRRVPPESWPTEGYYFAGAQYQMTLQALRLELARYHLAVRDEERKAHRRDTIVLRDVLHAKYSILMDSPELRPYLETVEGFRDSIEPLTDLNRRLDLVVERALESPEAYRRFDEEVDPLSQRVVSMANDLRVAELVAFEAAFEAQRRATVVYQEAGLALLAMLGMGLIAHVQIRRKEERAFRKEAEARAEAQRSAQARVALLGMVSHELRTPLQTMLADIEMLSITSKDDAGRRAVSSLERSIGLVSGQLDDIAQYTRLASGTYEVRRERFSLIPMLERIIDEHRASAQSGRQLVLDVALAGDTMVEGDPIRLHQVINNFISNAIKYGGPDEISVSAELESPGGSDRRDMAVVKVSDNGPGIPDADRASIWEPFVRGRRGQGRSKGSGLGLAVVRLLADSAGWQVGVLDKAPRGATFFVRFPLTPTDLETSRERRHSG